MTLATMDSPRIRPFTPADAYWVIERHAALYAQEEGFDATFGTLVAQILKAFMANPNVNQNGWIAEGAQ